MAIQDLQILPTRFFRKALMDAFESDPELLWLVVPCSHYKPLVLGRPPNPQIFMDQGSDYVKLDKISMYHSVQEPILVTRENVGLVDDQFLKRVETLPEEHEMALGVTWVGGFKDTTQKWVHPVIFDGRPGLSLATVSENAKLNLQNFTILETGGGHHFYLKGNPLITPDYKLQNVINELIDNKWVNYRDQNGGYIRVTAKVKRYFDKY